MTMKDAHGHGSDSGNPSTIKSGGLRGVGLAAGYSAPIGAANRRPDRDFKSDADRTVYDLRQRMASTGPGHTAGLMQGVKNLLGG
jgi:hypothetical protein